MIILQQPRMGKQSELYTHMPWEETSIKETEQSSKSRQTLDEQSVSAGRGVCFQVLFPMESHS